MIYDVIIIGAGAAGLMAALRANQLGKTVLILEKNSKPGLKILISGGGRCNFTNLNVESKHYTSANSHFCKSALSQYSNQDFIDLVQMHKIEFYEKTLGQLFCKKSSKQILNLLLSKIKNDQLLTNCAITDISKSDLFLIQTNLGSFKSHNLIVATGGLSFKKLGATDLGYKIAQKFGHTITPLSPALDGFVFSKNLQKDFSQIAGISLKATVCTGGHSFTEPLLFTHVGLSGPSVLKASLYWEQNQKVEIDFLPHIHHLKQHLHEAIHNHGKKMALGYLVQWLPKQFCDTLFKHSAFTNKKLAELSKTDIQEIESLLKTFQFQPVSTVGYEKAEVTKGGVSTKDLSGKTLESKLVPGLFFVGEVVDVTGLLGGYNFQWAWSSGYVAASHLNT